MGAAADVHNPCVLHVYSTGPPSKPGRQSALRNTGKRCGRYGPKKGVYHAVVTTKTGVVNTCCSRIGIQAWNSTATVERCHHTPVVNVAHDDKGVINTTSMTHMTTRDKAYLHKPARLPTPHRYHT
jgi:hypothetical protein